MVQKRTWFFILRFGISAGILIYIFTRPEFVGETSFGQAYTLLTVWHRLKISLGKVAQALADVQLSFLGTAIIYYGAVLLMGCLRWKGLLDAHGIAISFTRALQLYFIGSFFNSFLPSLTGGDIVKAYYISKETTRRAEAVSTVVMDRLAGLSAMFAIGLCAAWANIGHAEMSILVRAISILALVFVLLLSLLSSRKILGKVISVNSPILSKLSRIYGAFSFYRTRKLALVRALLLSLIIQLSMIIINYLLALGLGMESVSLQRFFLLIPITSMISAIPISIAGWGVGEEAYRRCFGLIGVPATLSIPLSFTLRLIFLGFSLIGLPFYLLHKPPETQGAGE